jgi:formylglycine-generating enzyme required for sulfatase activity
MGYNLRITVENGSNRVLRGGCWINDAHNCRAAYRNDNHPANRDNDVGFRLLSSLLRQECIVYVLMNNAPVQK